MRLKRGPLHFSRPANIIVADWAAADKRDLMRSFGSFSPPHSLVTIIADSAAAAKGLPRRLGNCRFRFLQHDEPTSTEVRCCWPTVPGADALRSAPIQILRSAAHIHCCPAPPVCRRCWRLALTAATLLWSAWAATGSPTSRQTRAC